MKVYMLTNQARPENNNLDHGTKFRVYEEKFYIMAELDSYALSINSLASRIIHDL